ncbi:MAG: MiaB/RimO family radical SAM methylthiotransferase [Planctomycetota bacterium]|jgi:threonylcarbamoyladenosine tRNA methylthiotransferase MtaB|nr:tRNA (N(6)-L-threonylcarbamoyladenosine(37)-C(2))-methylthiotransferase MtaB [Planctomycetota bacterium]MDP6956339.1 MiaB/RimO family radical SAM methylthiotransferase [Planctomycetota bacterium]
MGRVRFLTFGCKANQYDTQVLREALGRRGWTEGQGDAELVVVNTCAVTAEATRRARQQLRRLHRENPRARLCVTGCLAESEADALADLPGVEWVLGNGEAKLPVNFLREIGEEVTPEELGIPPGICEFTGHTRAFLKVQDGCDMTCAFCIIPRVRGKSRSRPLEELAAETRRLLAAGHVEIVLCGIHIGHWGREWGLHLSDLVRVLADIAAPAQAPWRLRLSSIEATEVGAELPAIMADRPERVAPHLHMPLQAGDDRTLKAMGRWYGVDEYLAACERIRAQLDRPAFTTDILIGFPGEDDESFSNTLNTVSNAGFASLHIFPFSARPGTRAAELGEPPSAATGRDLRARRAALADLGMLSANAYRRSLVGLEEQVVLEGSSGLCGRYQRLRLEGNFPGVTEQAAPGALVPVRLALCETQTFTADDSHGEDNSGRRTATSPSSATVTLVGLPLHSADHSTGDSTGQATGHSTGEESTVAHAPLPAAVPMPILSS